MIRWSLGECWFYSHGNLTVHTNDFARTNEGISSASARLAWYSFRAFDLPPRALNTTSRHSLCITRRLGIPRSHLTMTNDHVIRDEQNGCCWLLLGLRVDELLACRLTAAREVVQNGSRVVVKPLLRATRTTFTSFRFSQFCTTRVRKLPAYKTTDIAL
jgi:hypothetical protein